MLLGVCDKMN